MDRDKILSKLHRKYPTLRFDFSQSQTKEEINLTSRIIATCPIHGESSPLPLEAVLYRGRVGCSCLTRSILAPDPLKFKKKRSLGDIQERVTALYPQERYTVTGRAIVNGQSVLTCTCAVHGIFTVNMNRMLACKQSCPGCGSAAKVRGISLTQEQFMNRLPSHIKRDYDLTHTRYTGMTNSVIVVCGEHGEFKITAASLSNGAGCKRCGVERRVAKDKNRGEESFRCKLEMLQARATVTLRPGTYLGTHSPATLICAEHGEFRFIPALMGNTLKRGLSPCPFCNGNALCDLGIQRDLANKIFPPESLVLEGYTVAKQPMRLKCLRCGGVSYKHLADIRRAPFLICLKCADFDELKACGIPVNETDDVPHWLYVIELTLTSGPPLYKVGITTRSPEARVTEFGINRKKIVGWKTIYTEPHESKISAYLREQRILSIYEYERNFNLDLLLNGGNTEIIFSNPLKDM